MILQWNGFGNWAKALAMFINCHELKLVVIDADIHWALAQMQSLLTSKFSSVKLDLYWRRTPTGIKID